MSNNLIAVSSNLPDYLRGGELTYEDSGLGAGITPRAPKLSVTTSKQWCVTKDGQQMILPTPTVKAVLVASAQNITKAWYAKGYVPGSTDAPDCYSNDGKTPAPGVKAAQCGNCAGCPKNAFGSHPVTGRGKACGDRKLVVLVWEGAPNELMTFNVPTMSMQSLRKLDTELRNANIPTQSVLVEMGFDPAIQYPVVKIAAVGFVDKATAMNLLDRSKSQEVADLLRESDFEAPAEQQQQLASPVPQQVVQFGAPAAEAPAAAHPGLQLPPAAETPLKRRRRTKAEMEAARAAETPQQREQFQQDLASMLGEANTPVQETPVPQQVVQQETQQTTPAAAGGLDIGSLMAKWKS